MSGGQKRHDAGTFHGLGQLALMPGADAGALGRKNLHVKIHETSQEAGILVIDISHLVGAEEALLFFLWLIIVHNGYFGRVILIYEYILISRMPIKNIFVILVCIRIKLVLHAEIIKII